MVRTGEINGDLKPSIPYLEFYYAESATADIAPLWNNILWIEQLMATSDLLYQTDGTICQIVVVTTGMYRIDLEIGFDNSSCGGIKTVTTRMLNNGVEILGSRSSTGSENVFQLNTSRTVYLKSGDKITFEYQTDSNATVFSAADYSRLRFSYVPLGGWNNNSGGTVVNRMVRR